MSAPKEEEEVAVEEGDNDEKDGQHGTSGLGARAKKFLASKTASTRMGRKVIVQLMGEYGETVMKQLESAATKVWDKKLAEKLERNFLKVALKAKILVDEGRLNIKDELILKSVEPTTHLVVDLIEFLSLGIATGGTASSGPATATAAAATSPSASPKGGSATAEAKHGHDDGPLSHGQTGEHIHEHDKHDKQHATDTRTPLQRIQAHLGLLKTNVTALLTPLQKPENVARTVLLFDHLGNDKLLTALVSDSHLKGERESILKNLLAIVKPWKSSSSPLFVATQRGSATVVGQLLGAGMDPNAKKMNGATPLYIAAQNGELSVARELVSGRANVNAQRDGGATPLFIASQEGHTAMVELLLSAKANANQTRENGATALFMACAKGFTAIVELLLKHGADPNHSEKDGAFPLYVACYENHQKVVELLVEMGASVNQTRENGYFPLFVAAKRGSRAVVDYLVKHGAKVNQAEKEGATPLYISAQNGHSEVVDLLLRNGGQVNKARDDTGASALFIACQEGHVDVARLLVAHKADINQPKKNGFTAVYVAANGHQYALVELLVAHGAAVELDKLGAVEKFGDADKISAAVAKGRQHPVTAAPAPDTVVSDAATSDLSNTARPRAQ